MKRIILSLALSVALALPAGAVYPVYDAPLHAQTAIDQVFNYAKATAAYIKQTEPVHSRAHDCAQRDPASGK
jgi:hypothetical protein